MRRTTMAPWVAVQDAERESNDICIRQQRERRPPRHRCPSRACSTTMNARRRHADRYVPETRHRWLEPNVWKGIIPSRRQTIRMAGPTREFWDARFQSGETPWDRGAVHPQLETWLAAGALRPCRI